MGAQMEDTHVALTLEEGEVLPDPKTPGGGALDLERFPPIGDMPLIRGFYGVFDGHGGHNAANFVEDYIYDAFVRQCLTSSNCARKDESIIVMRKTFAETEAALIEASKSHDWIDGTTAAVVAVLEDSEIGLSLVAANVGDTEMLVGWCMMDETPQYTLLSESHNAAKNEVEQARVCKAGGQLCNGRLAHPIFPRVASLAVTRAFGDLFFKDLEATDGKPSGLTADPFIIYRRLTRHDRFLLIGCDGFFESVNYHEAVQFIFTRLGAGEAPQSVSQALVELARRQGSKDNITVQLVMVQTLGSCDNKHG